MPDVPTVVAAAVKVRSGLADLFAEVGRVATSVAAIWGLIHGGAIVVPAPPPPAPVVAAERPAPVAVAPPAEKPAPPPEKPAEKPGKATDSTSLDAQLVPAVNAERKAAGLPALESSADADRASGAWAGVMAKGDTLSHGDFHTRIAKAFPGRGAGEDIAVGQADGKAVVDAWMADPPHRANLLGPYTLIGCGRAVGPAGRIYWCVDFIR